MTYLIKQGSVNAQGCAPTVIIIRNDFIPTFANRIHITHYRKVQHLFLVKVNYIIIFNYSPV